MSKVTDLNEYKATFGSGFKVLAQVPEGETIRQMFVHQGRLLVATDKNIYELKGSRLELLNLEFTDDQ